MCCCSSGSTCTKEPGYQVQVLVEAVGKPKAAQDCSIGKRFTGLDEEVLRQL
jgi:hypothetical protein